MCTDYSVNGKVIYGLKRKNVLLAGEGKREETAVSERLTSYYSIYSVSCFAVFSPSTYIPINRPFPPSAPLYQPELSADSDIPLRPIHFTKERSPIHTAGRATLDSGMESCRWKKPCWMSS